MDKEFRRGFPGTALSESMEEGKDPLIIFVQRGPRVGINLEMT